MKDDFYIIGIGGGENECDSTSEYVDGWLKRGIRWVDLVGKEWMGDVKEEEKRKEKDRQPDVIVSKASSPSLPPPCSEGGSRVYVQAHIQRFVPWST